MGKDDHLYGQRPPKKQKKEMAISSSLDFASQLTSLMSKPGAGSSSSATSTAPAASSVGRARPSKSKDIFSDIKIKRRAGARASPATDDNADADADADASRRDPRRIRLRSPVGTEDDKAERARARRKMEEKARLYAAMKRGDYVPSREGEAAPLVDFDRKWAERHPGGNKDGDDDGGLVSSSSGSDDEDEDEDNNDREIIEYTDEFGRVRTGTAADKLRMERRLQRGEQSLADLERMSARPRAPEALIFGDAVQTGAFETADAAKMEELAAKRDRSATPPPATHYEADKEIRTKGVGFYAFSKDEERRQQEMKNLAEERARTEQVRKEREEKLEARRAEIEARRREIEARRKEKGERRAKQMADSFLDGLREDLLTPRKEDEGNKRKHGAEL
ncbi:uncharacterized protein E0L32_001404 [Thyridium curvatum]|uniref:Uncharacterized protein n=1 Tax=Thyridium curvatum TaxID=1093900 RepID=A0A507ARW9_9PEZI|nr:uncharacterized protein E0L32_001404 [Thyridium curvatum]TPX10207.1 hypothetical protein E0L32_001404 [Thyridium curvatum]